MSSLFGTDGIRGKANVYPITPEIALNVGRAVACLLKHNDRARVIIGKDTRLSGDMIENALAAGVCSAGGDVRTAGVLPTPALAYLTRSGGFDAGVVVSASHNPYYDNGIKIIDQNGFKLPRETEEKLEREILECAGGCQPAEESSIGTIRPEADAEERYVDFIAGSRLTGLDFAGLKIVLDCSNGAAYRVARRVFSKLGADVTAIFDTPDGVNINDHCGSQYVGPLREKVIETGADVGLAFDGDGDRLIAVDEKGATVTGDQVLAVCAKQMKETGTLTNNLVVITVMSNAGLKDMLDELGIRHITTDVGDRFVLAAMQKNGAVLGGEDSGHTIFLDRHTSGDGVLTGLRLIETMRQSGRSLSELSAIIKIYPQVLKNVQISRKMDIFSIPEIAEVISDVESRLCGQGRVLVRYSGTQPLCRVMVEAADREMTERCCDEIVDIIKAKIGAKRSV